MTTLSLNDRVNQFSKLVVEDSSSRADFKAAESNFDTSSRARTYAMLADALAILSDYLFTTEDKKVAELIRAYNERQIAQPKPHENPFFSGVKMLWGSFHETETVDYLEVKRRKFIPNSSANKYAYALRWLYENDVPDREIVARIEGFKGKMHGIIEADKAAHRSDSDKAARVQKKVEELTNPALSISDAVEDLPTPVLEDLSKINYVLAALRKAPNGEWVLMEFVKGSEKDAERVVRKLAQDALRAEDKTKPKVEKVVKAAKKTGKRGAKSAASQSPATV
ncbi:hypothetical protein [Roseomonas harenae]|uniref:hypothetical protein n=1 Tax=Muricoccus harenae TaxID=2692566 RepID=UPI00133146B6|nr:hypothetical protein [Roseomonas harenae]